MGKIANEKCVFCGQQIPSEAYWKWDPNAYDFNIGGWVCSHCGASNDNLPHGEYDGPHINPYLFKGSKYCPQCGAKMILRSEKNG